MMKTRSGLVTLLLVVSGTLFWSGCETTNPARALAQRDMERASQRAQTSLFLDGYTESSSVNYEKSHRGAGVGLGYEGREASLSLYFYSGGRDDVPAGADSPAVAAEFISSAFALLAGQKQGLYEQLSVSDGYLYEYDGQEFWRADASMTTQNGGAFSFLLLTGLNGEFFKIRMSMPTATELPSEEILENVLEQLSPQLGFGTEPQTETFGAEAVDLSSYFEEAQK